MVVHTFNQALGKKRQGDPCEFNASLVCIVKFFLKKQNKQTKNSIVKIWTFFSLDHEEVRVSAGSA